MLISNAIKQTILVLFYIDSKIDGAFLLQLLLTILNILLDTLLEAL